MFCIAMLLFTVLASNAAAQTVNESDLKMLEGADWVGELTYLDYGSNKKVSIKSDLKVTRNGSGRTWEFSYIYPDEPKANGESAVSISPDGRMINGQTVIETKRGDNGIRQIVTTMNAEDDGKKAQFRFTYSIGRNEFSIVKEVQFAGSRNWIERNTYRWTR